MPEIRETAFDLSRCFSTVASRQTKVFFIIFFFVQRSRERLSTIDPRLTDPPSNATRFPLASNSRAGIPTVVRAKNTEDKGLFVDTEARHYGVSSLLKQPFDPSDGLVVQYEATTQEGLQCGGAYLKFINTDEKAFTPDTLDGDSPYTLMFGPDRCGGTDKVHVIFRHASPGGTVQEKHLASPPRVPSDKLPHLYGLAITPKGDVTVKIDGEAVFEGSLFDEKAFEPPFNPPEEIDDPADSKPEDWVDDPQMDDPDAVKPEDWDEDAPSMIPDESKEKPEGWLDDEPDTVEDPAATRPEDWDEDEDGTWEAPMVNNPKCEEAPGCGVWTRPTKYNPDYKGKWYPPRVENPEYKGEWSPRKIPNPDHYVDETPLKNIGTIGAVALEIWTMSSGLVVDNVLIAKDSVAASELETNAWRPKFDFLKAMADAEEKSKFESESKADEPGFAARAKDTVADALFAAANALPEGSVRDRANAFVTSLAESTASMFSFVALIALVVLFAVSLLFGSDAASDEKRKKAAETGKKKKSDAPEPDDEKEEEEEEEEEEEAEETVKSPSARRRTTKKA